MTSGIGVGRKAFLATAIGSLLLIAGCGGSGRKEATANTGTDGGSLYDVQITPSPGTTFIASTTEFTLSWSDSAPPPSTFTAVLQRYREARGDETRTIETQRTELNRQGSSYIWILRRTDNFDLEAGGVYFIELTSGSEQVMATYIISSDRSVPTAQTEKTAVLASQTDDSLVHTVKVR